MSNQTVLITGANRGIGLGLATAYLKQINVTVIAAVRDPSNIADLTAVHPADGSKLVVVRIRADSETDAAEAIATLQTTHGINALDIVLANAGISEPETGKVESVDIASLRRHLEVNTIGPIVLFQAALPLLRKAKDSKFAVTSTFASSSIYPSRALQTGFHVGAYMISKAAVNSAVNAIRYENPEITVILFHPGTIVTDMLKAFGAKLNADIAAFADTTVEDSAKSIIKLIAETTKGSEKEGKLVNVSKEGYPVFPF